MSKNLATKAPSTVQLPITYELSLKVGTVLGVAVKSHSGRSLVEDGESEGSGEVATAACVRRGPTRYAFPLLSTVTPLHAAHLRKACLSLAALDKLAPKPHLRSAPLHEEAQKGLL